MAKQIKMLNIQNSIILIVLMATTLMTSAMNSRRLPAPPAPPQQPLQVTEEEIQMFVDHLEHYRRITGDKVNGINHFNSWEYWNDTSRALKEDCVMEYWDELDAAGMDENSDRDELGRLAYKTLDTHITQSVAIYLGYLANNRPLTEGMQSIQDKGEYLKFSAFWETAHDATIGCLIGQLMAKNPHMDIDQANLLAILPGYLARVH